MNFDERNTSVAYQDEGRKLGLISNPNLIEDFYIKDYFPVCPDFNRVLII